MQGRVGKDRVDRLLDGEVVRVGDPKVGARESLPGCLDHRRVRVDADHGRSSARDLRCQLAGAATEVQDGLARLWIQPVQELCSVGRDECEVPVVLPGVPALGHAVNPFTQVSSSVAPASPDFSGWNWVADNAPFSTAAMKRSPSCSVQLTSGGCSRCGGGISQRRTP